LPHLHCFAIWVIDRSAAHMIHQSDDLGTSRGC
jgi:hypothetical protein